MIFVFYSIIGIAFTFLSSRFIFGGDSAEFSTAALTWSIPHPPGYPLYALLTNLVRLLPIGTPPWRISLLSVVPAMITAYMIYRILKINSISWLISLLTSVLFLILFPVWQYSLIPEVFLFSAMLISVATYCVFAYLKENKIGYIYLFCLLIGLNISHHHIFVLFIPGWLFLLKNTIRLTKKTIITCFLLLLAGSLFYLYAPIASFFNPPLDWENAKTLSGLWRLITRSTYGTFSAYSGSKPDILIQLYDFIAILLFVIQDFRIPGILLLFISFFVGRKIRSTLFGFLVITSILLFCFLTYTNFILSFPFTTAMYERFLINLYFIFCMFIALAIQYLISTFSRYKNYMLIIFAVYICVLALTNFKSIRHIKDLSYFDRLGIDIINTVPHNGILYVGSDNTYFPTLYHLYGLRERKDLTLIQINLIKHSYYVKQLRAEKKLRDVPSQLSEKDGSLERLFQKNEEKGIYMENPFRFGYWLPYGLLWKYYSTEAKMNSDISHVIQKNELLWKNTYKIPTPSLEEKNILHLQVVQDFYLKAYVSYSKLLFIGKEYDKAIQLINRILKIRPHDTVLQVTKLNILVYQKKCDEATNYKKSLVIDGDLLTNSTQSLKSLKDYYASCDPKNPRRKLLEKIGK